MAITRIRGGQIHDRTIEGIKIQTGALLNEHVAAGAAIHESKLDINWASHGQDILQTKKVVDYIQVNSTTAGDLDTIDVSALNIFGGSTPAYTNSDPLSAEGIIVDAPKNRVALRDSVSGDPVLDAHGHEVYGRMVYTVVTPEVPESTEGAGDGTPEVGKYELKFFTMESEEGSDVETSYTMPTGQVIDWQYAQRFNLQTVNEMFAANEKFVEGTADATAHLNIEQLAKDLYGAGFHLDRDGNANLVKSLAEQIADELSARQLADEALQQAIDDEAEARATADTAIRTDLSSTMVGKGASIIGIEDAGDKFISTTVETALAELADRATALEGGGSATGQEVEAARKSTALTGAEVSYESLDERIEAGEAVVKATNDEVVAARGTDADLKTRLDGIDTRNTTIEAKNSEQDGRLDDIETEIEDARANGASTPVVFDSLKDRLDQADADLAAEIANRIAADEAAADDLQDYKDSNDARVETLETEVTAARGSKASIDERLDVALNEDGTLKVSNKIHQHKKYIEQIASNASIINMPEGQVYVVGDGSLSVYVNGILQANGINFTEVAGGASIDFGSDQLLAGDVVVIEYVVYGV